MDIPVIGIDLGTTYSAVAFINEHGRPEIIRNADGQPTTPSVVLIEGDRIVVGEPALNQWITNEEHVVRWVKWAIGDDTYRFQGRTAVEISAEILKALKADAERHFGMAVRQAVITCPAWFNANQIENTRRAGELAGFQVKEIMKEPTAAALHYGIDNMHDGQKIMICDLGGGTFDCTILALCGETFDPLQTAGDRELGGHDWTQALLELVAERAVERFGEDPRNDLVSRQMLYEACEQAKRDFARLAQLEIPCRVAGRMESIAVTREELERATEWLVTQMTMRIEEARSKSGLAWTQIDRILLVGGSSRLRRMAEAIRQLSGRQPIISGEADLTVAYGAAILARGAVRRRSGKAGSLVVGDIKRRIPRSLGTRVLSGRGKQARIVTAELIPAGTEAPVERPRDDYIISWDDQPFFELPIVESVSEDTFDILRNYQITCRPNSRRGDRIRVVFRYNASGEVSAEAVDLKTDAALTAVRTEYKEPDLTSAASEKRPCWFVFAIDVSGSMDGSKLTNAKSSLLENARQLLGGRDGRTRVGVVSFSDSAQVVSAPTEDFAALERAVSAMRTAGLTAMDEGILLALHEVAQAPAGVDRHVILLTDGMPDRQRRDATLAAAMAAREHRISLWTLGVGRHGVDESFLRQMTDRTFVVDGASQIGEAMAALLSLADEQRVGQLVAQ